MFRQIKRPIDFLTACPKTACRLVLLLCMIGLNAIPYSVLAQEFDCQVSVNSRQISSGAHDHVRNLAPELERYINENRWTDDRYESYERIRCRIQILLTDVDSQDNFSAEAVFQLRRPVYDTMQETVTVVLSDTNWAFHYPRNRSLIRDEMQYDALTSFIDFYIYLLLGYDYDTFSELGGTPFFNRAQEVSEIAQASGSSGWDRSFGSQRNRHGLIRDLQNPIYEELRRAYYRYHRLGLDPFTENQEQARNEVIEALDMIGETRRRATNNYLFDIFFDTKYTELVSVFLNATPVQRQQAYDLLTAIDPGHSSEYDRLR